MPRTRSRSKKQGTDQVQDSTTSADTTSTDATSNNTNGGKKMAGLSPEQIAALLGASRTKGVYIAKLTEFMNSGEGGVCANEEWPELADKATATLKQGFENAKNSKNAPEGVENVRVITNEDKVYLINAGAASAAA